MTALKKACFAFVAVWLAAYVLVCILMSAFQRDLMYHTWRAIEAPQSYGLSGYTVATLTDTDGTHIQAWYRAANAGFPTLVYFHGNGGNMANEVEYFHVLGDAGFGLLAMDYRGYGASGGSPCETGFYQDARAALAYATGTLHVPQSRIILYGESIGTGVAVQMATEYPVAAVVLQSPYTSVEARARDLYLFLPVHWLIKDRFDSLGKIATVHAPLLVLHGEKDAVVPIIDGRILFAHANAPKQFVSFPGEGHNDLDIAGRLKALLAFCHTIHLIHT
jgi:fermentation-respiration switch protein FrsA (DUF1100 family)